MAVSRSMVTVPDAMFELNLQPLGGVSDEAFARLCQANPEMRLERLASGVVVVMPPAGFETGHRNLAIAAAVHAWAERDGTGVAADSSAGYVLPNRAIRSPDVSWVRRKRLGSLSPEATTGFLPLCPDFVVELRSASDRLAALRAKMDEYIACGARLGWLIDPEEHTVTVYRPGAEPERLEAPERISGEPELPGLVVELAAVWRGAVS